MPQECNSGNQKSAQGVFSKCGARLRPQAQPQRADSLKNRRKTGVRRPVFDPAALRLTAKILNFPTKNSRQFAKFASDQPAFRLFPLCHSDATRHMFRSQTFGPLCLCDFVVQHLCAPPRSPALCVHLNSCPSIIVCARELNRAGLALDLKNFRCPGQVTNPLFRAQSFA